jgi:carbon monoxide dehydrogenase subunit G
VKLEDTFTIPADRERSWQLLQDIPAVARCLPGAQLLSVDDETCSGIVKVKIGPIVMSYHGQLQFTERDPDAGVMALRASGKDKRSAGSVTGAMRLVETSTGPDQTSFDLDVDLDLTGKPAQFGRGAIQDVSTRLIGQFAQNLAALVDQEPTSQTAPASTTPTSTAALPPNDAEPFDVLGGDLRRNAVVAGLATAGAAVLAGIGWLLLRRTRHAGGDR